MIMKKIVPIVLAVIIAFFVVTLVDPISHPDYMIGKWDAKDQAAYKLYPLGICLTDGLPGRWYVKDGYVYLSALFAYEKAEIVDEKEWIMYVSDKYDRIWTKVE